MDCFQIASEYLTAKDREHRMSLTGEQELWAMALWIEKTQGENAWFYIAQQKDRLLADGDPLGLGLWNEVERRLEMLANGSAVPN